MDALQLVVFFFLDDKNDLVVLFRTSPVPRQIVCYFGLPLFVLFYICPRTARSPILTTRWRVSFIQLFFLLSSFFCVSVSFSLCPRANVLYS